MRKTKISQLARKKRKDIRPYVIFSKRYYLSQGFKNLFGFNFTEKELKETLKKDVKIINERDGYVFYLDTGVTIKIKK